jgi:hypothetical protein
MYIHRFQITKLASRILLLLFLYNSIGYFFIFKCVQSAIKKQASQTIQSHPPDKLLKDIAFHKNNLNAINWMEEDKELLYNGRLYDVAKTTETTDSVIYHCLSDVLEDDLNDQLDDHVKNNVTENTLKHPSKKAPLEPIQLYFSTGPFLSFDLLSFSIYPPVSLSASYLPVYIEMIAPPPKFS